MSTIGMVRDLAEFFLGVGIVGAGIALLCAMVVGVALAMGAAGIAGGASAVWIGGALLSLSAGFSGQWMPTLVAGGGIIAGLVFGGVARAVMRRLAPRPRRAREVAAPAASVPAVTASVSTPVPRRVVVRAVPSESIR